jgi:tRNA A-37 threonylcarbamoyl transferase component Bud32
MVVQSVKNDNFMSPKWVGLFDAHQLNSFDALWNASFTEVDIPNKSKDGWSSVALMELADADGHTQRFYIKRQEAYNCFSFKAPIKGIPVFEREFGSIQRFENLDLPALTAVFFGKRLVADRPQAILITEALDNYQPMDEWLAGCEEGVSEQRKQLVVALGKAVATLHRKGLAHRALYSKHVFVKTDTDVIDESALAYIDLETARPHLGLLKFKLRDLCTLYRRSGLSTAEYRDFLKIYLGQSEWNAQCQKLLNKIESKAGKKKR